MNEQELRRDKNNDYIERIGIACYRDLPTIESSSEVFLKSFETITKKAIASLFVIQLACDILNETDYNEALGIVLQFLEKYNINLEVDLNKLEKKLINGTYTKQDALDVSWEYETYWALVWALGFVDNIVVPDDVCNSDDAINIIMENSSYEEFTSKARLRNLNEILDMVDLYYRYDWACTEKRINPETPIGFLNPEVVYERRRGLEWLISSEMDWHDISLDS